MHLGADGVADVAPHDREPGPLGHCLNGQADVVEAVALDQLTDTGHQALLGHPQQLFGKGGTSPTAPVTAASPW